MWKFDLQNHCCNRINEIVGVSLWNKSIFIPQKPYCKGATLIEPMIFEIWVNWIFGSNKWMKKQPMKRKEHLSMQCNIWYWAHCRWIEAWLFSQPKKNCLSIRWTSAAVAVKADINIQMFRCFAFSATNARSSSDVKQNRFRRCSLVEWMCYAPALKCNDNILKWHFDNNNNNNNSSVFDRAEHTGEISRDTK